MKLRILMGILLLFSSNHAFTEEIPNTNIFKSCYIDYLLSDIELWKSRTIDRRKQTRTKRYYRKAETTKSNYERWFQVELDRLQEKYNKFAPLVKKYGKVDKFSKKCTPYTEFYYRSVEIESIL